MQSGVRELNIKGDMPTADTAVRRVTHALHTSRELGYAALKLIHGYGSSGTGGRIRTETRAYLARQKSRGLVREIIPGEQFSIFDEATRRAFAACPDLRRDADLDRHNNGMTIVVL